MRIINIIVRDKIAMNPTRARYVCGNSDFVIRFDFDSEWNEIETKTARFVYGNTYHDQVFTGNECPVPIISNVNVFEVGVFAGNLRTSTSAQVPADKSILCKGGMPVDPAPNVYVQIMKKLNELDGGLPEANAPHMQLVSDKDGNTVWEEKLAYKTVTTQKGYEYIYQDAALTGPDDSMYYATTPPAVEPTAGDTYTIFLDGKEYTSKCVDASVVTGGAAAVYVLGNASALGGSELPFENPDPDAQYCVMIVPVGEDGVYCMVIIGETLSTPALTIRSMQEVETTTTDIKKVDRELLDIPTTDMGAAWGSDGYIENRPCWEYTVPGGKIVWDGSRVSSDALYQVMPNGTYVPIAYKVCDAPMNKHTFYNIWGNGTIAINGGVWQFSTVRFSDTDNGISSMYSDGGDGVQFYSAPRAGELNSGMYKADAPGLYIVPTEHEVVWSISKIVQPIDNGFLPPPANSDGTYYLRWDGNSWEATGIDTLKADLGLS